MSSSKPPKPSSRTSLSSEKLRAIQTPPTKIEGKEMRLDPMLVVKAWADSADILKDVAAAVRENQDDNEHVREAIARNRRFLVGAGIVITLLQVVSVVAVFSVTRQAEDKISRFVAEQTEVNDSVRQEARKTREEAERIRAEARLMTTAVAAALRASVVTQGEDDAASKERAILEAEVTIAAAQAKMSDDPKVKAQSQETAKRALKRAEKRSSVIGPVAVDPELLEDL